MLRPAMDTVAPATVAGTVAATAQDTAPGMVVLMVDIGAPDTDTTRGLLLQAFQFLPNYTFQKNDYSP